MVWCVTVEQLFTLLHCTSVIKVIYQVRSLMLEFAGTMEHGLEVPQSAVRCDYLRYCNGKVLYMSVIKGVYYYNSFSSQ